MDYFNVFKIIQSANNILLITHRNPDGDAVGSMCAIIELIKILNKKKYTAFCVNQPGAQFSFLPNIEKISSDKTCLDLAKFDLIIIIDCGSLKQTELSEEVLKLISSASKNSIPAIIEFDHHPKIENNQLFNSIKLQIPEAAATTEILYDFFKYNKIKITKNIANCILTGILSDTSNFRHQTTSHKTIKIASEMLACGALFPQITKNIYRNINLDSIKLWSIVLNNLKINKKYNIAFTILTKKIIQEININNDFDAIANFLGNLREIKAVMFLREEDNGRIKGSLRSNSKVNVSDLAIVLNGGGHKKAAGFLINGKLEEVNGRWRVLNNE